MGGPQWCLTPARGGGASASRQPLRAVPPSLHHHQAAHLRQPSLPTPHMAGRERQPPPHTTPPVCGTPLLALQVCERAGRPQPLPAARHVDTIAPRRAAPPTRATPFRPASLAVRAAACAHVPQAVRRRRPHLNVQQPHNVFVAGTPENGDFTFQVGLGLAVKLADADDFNRHVHARHLAVALVHLHKRAGGRGQCMVRAREAVRPTPRAPYSYRHEGGGMVSAAARACPE